MIIGIDISQLVYEGTGVSRYVSELTRAVIKKGTSHSFVLFGASIRKKDHFTSFFNSLSSSEKNRVKLITVFLSPRILDFLWNKLHVLPIEIFTGALDVFWSSDWTQPPLRKARGVTTIHDMTPLRFPQTFSSEIIDVHKRKLDRSKEECSFFFCDSETTKDDVNKLLHIPADKLIVIYPGYTV